MTLLVTVLAGGPIDTSDVWFHLAVGETYVREGPWPSADPLLHTAHDDAPVQHEWLFGVAVFALERTIGLHGLRGAHAAAVLAIAAAALAIVRRRLPPWELAACVLSLFVATGWWRLIQLRPDLFSIPATLLFAELLFFADDVSSERWRWRVVAAAALAVVWANTHSLFTLGPALGIAALGAAGLDALLPGSSQADRAAARQRVARLAVALAVVLLVTLLNPRGVSQHLTFFTSSNEAAIWSIIDEWQHFDPLRWKQLGPALSPLAGLITNLTLAAMSAVALHTLWRCMRCLRGGDEVARAARPSAGELRLLALGLAGIVAALVSIRFAWMEIFAWIHLADRARGSRALSERPALLGWSAALCALALAAAFPGPGLYSEFAEELPDDVAGYLREPFTREDFFTPGVDFLEAAGLEGNLFNRYTMGGYLGHRLAPRIRTFVDGRTEHYPSEVLFDYFKINTQRRNDRGESALEALDRYGVDIYFGVGRPGLGVQVYTTPRLEAEPDWIQIFRSHDHSISLRRGERNRANLKRVADYYAERGVPFSREHGFDPIEALESAPLWATSAGVVPAGYVEMRSLASGGDPRERRAARQWLAMLYFLLGGYEAQIDLDRELIAEHPRGVFERWRIVHGLLRSGRTSEALNAAESLVAFDASPRSRAALAIARAIDEHQLPSDGRPLSSILYNAPLHTPAELRAFDAQGRNAP